MKRIAIAVFLLPCLLLCNGCTDSWLEMKPDRKLVVPNTLKDIQALLDNTNRMNSNVMANLLEVSSDNIYLPFDQWNAKSNVEVRNAYIWAANIYEGSAVSSWITQYGQVYYANTALEAYENLVINSVTEERELNNIRGSALFFRSWAFFNLAQLFCKQYGKSSAHMEPGIPLRLNSDILQSTTRATVSEVYQQIITDVNSALPLLPNLPTVPTRPSRVSSYSLLAKVYLQMGEYRLAKQYADSSLMLKNDLIDYNTLNSDARYPFAIFNEETIFYQTMATTKFYIDPGLYAAYRVGDLRKDLFFYPEGDYQLFKGSYSNSRTFFSGIATDEIYLIRAECNSRLGNFDEAFTDLDHLLTKRYEPGKKPVIDKNQLLETTLMERRLELVYRGLRWQDLRRLNLEDEWQITLKRDLNGMAYSLAPNSPRYVFALPDDVIANNPVIKQNER